MTERKEKGAESMKKTRDEGIEASEEHQRGKRSRVRDHVGRRRW